MSSLFDKGYAVFVGGNLAWCQRYELEFSTASAARAYAARLNRYFDAHRPSGTTHNGGPLGASAAVFKRYPSGGWRRHW